MNINCSLLVRKSKTLCLLFRSCVRLGRLVHIAGRGDGAEEPDENSNGDSDTEGCEKEAHAGHVVRPRLGEDPALASNIFLTMVTDIVGFTSFLATATLLLG